MKALYSALKYKDGRGYYRAWQRYNGDSKVFEPFAAYTSSPENASQFNTSDQAETRRLELPDSDALEVVTVCEVRLDKYLCDCGATPRDNLE